MKRPFILCLSFLLSWGCHRGADFLYHVKETPASEPSFVSFTHPLKEIIKQQGLLDMLWVIDNSLSMSPYQHQVIQNAEIFMNEFIKKGSIDWKLGLISTSPGEPPYAGFTVGTEITHKSVDPARLFQAAVSRLGIGGSGYEQAFRPIFATLTNHPGFLRSGAYLAIIIVTDAPEQSNLQTTDFVDFLVKAKGDINKIASYGVFGAQDLGCTATDNPWKLAGSKYGEFLALTKGVHFPICSPTYGKLLADIGKDLVQKVEIKAHIPLSNRPVVSTLQVSYKGKILTGGPKASGGVWHYDFDRNAIVFDDLSFAPGEEEFVDIQYTKVN